jgi:hypothetical protein
MIFPLSWADISLWLAAMAIILLATSELLNYSPEYAKYNINRTVLRWVAIGCGLAFAVTVLLHIAQVF